MNETPKVSICCISYNHGKFIRQALNSFLEQLVDFQIEIVISDDKSSDYTFDIIKEYGAANAKLFNIIERDRNVGPHMNFFTTLSACTGKYIAVCEGDDYWIDMNKLKEQIAIMEKDPDITLVTHDVEVLNQTVTSKAYRPYTKVPKVKGGFYEVLFSHFMPTLSMVFRKDALPAQWPEFFFKVKSPDKVLALTLLLKGNYYHFTKVMGVYRHHDGGITKKNVSVSDWLKGELFLYNQLFSFFKIEDDALLRKRLALSYYTAFRISASNNNFLQAVKYLCLSICYSPLFLVDYFVNKRL